MPPLSRTAAALASRLPATGAGGPAAPPFRQTSLVARVRQVLGRALRETGQMVDRVGIRMDENTVDYDMDDREQSARPPAESNRFDHHLSRHRTVMPLIGHAGGEGPKIAATAFIAPCASVVGAVEVSEDASVWFGAVLRADRFGGQTDRNAVSGPRGYFVSVGPGTNVQDGAIVSAFEGPAVLGPGVTVGHRAQIMSATVGPNALIGMGAVVMPGATVEGDAYVGAGAVIAAGTTVGTRELWVGNPARKIRDLTEEQVEKLSYQADEYVKLSKKFVGVMELGGNVSDEKLLESLSIMGVVEPGDPIAIDASPTGENPDGDEGGVTRR